MLIYGAGGHARVIIEAIESNNLAVAAVFDDYRIDVPILDYRVVGEYSPIIDPDDQIIVAIGDNLKRRLCVMNVRHAFGKTIHPSAVVSPRAKVGIGSVVLHNSTVQTQVEIGDHAIINTAASVGHNCQIGDFAHISPNATLCGTVKVGTGTQIGAGSVVVQNMSIGKWCVVAAGATIVHDIPDFSVVMGTPGRIVGLNTEAIQKFGDDVSKAATA